MDLQLNRIKRAHWAQGSTIYRAWIYLGRHLSRYKGSTRSDVPVNKGKKNRFALIPRPGLASQRPLGMTTKVAVKLVTVIYETPR
jgi:hypothetical protein